MQIIKEGLLRVDPGLLLWTMITFMVLLLLLWKAAWRPIIDALDARSEKVRGDIDKAEKSRQEAEKLLDQYKETMNKAKEEASSIIAKGKEEAEKVRSEIVEKANKEAKDVVDRVKREIELAKDNALAEIKTEIVVLSTDIASKIVKKNISAGDQKSLVDEALKNMRTVQ